jgi:hypothetical protein
MRGFLSGIVIKDVTLLGREIKKGDRGYSPKR